MKEVRGEYRNRGNRIWSAHGIHPKVLSLVEKGGGNALDLGCGSGSLAKDLLEKGYSVVGADIENFLRHPNIIFKKLDLDERWNFKENTFDLVTATEIIEHLENPRHFIREIKRILKKGGISIISTPNIFNWKARIYYPLRGFIWGFEKNCYKISGHITPMAKYDFERICEEENLEIEHITYNNSNSGLFGENIIVVIKK